MQTRLLFSMIAAAALVAGCVPARPVAVSPAPAPPPPRRVEAPRPAPRPEPPRAEYREVPDREGVSVMYVSAEPGTVRRGGEVELVVEYIVNARRGRDVDVLETFEVRYDGAIVSMPTSTRSVGAGRHETRMKLSVPSDAQRGSYEVAAYVATDEGEDSGGSTFKVR